MHRFIRIVSMVFFVLVIIAPPLFAEGGRAGGGAPEIDPSMAPSAIALLTGGLLILKSKIRRK
jgi:hypothetical protein